MANPSSLRLPLLLLSVLSISGTATLAVAAGATASNSNFIKTSCSTTLYPSLCVKSLSVYAFTIQQDPHQLVQTALSLSLNSSIATRDAVFKLYKLNGLKPREYAALNDCVEEIADSVDRLTRSLKELKLCRSNGQDFAWHISNVETWVSSALTDETTCTDGFAGKALNGQVKSSIRARIVNVAHVTSNALSLINKYASTY